MQGRSFYRPKTRSILSNGPTKSPRRRQTGTHNKKEERFHPSGQLLWDRGELDRPFVPRSDVHKHTVTLGESKNPKDYRREDWDQPDENGPSRLTWRRQTRSHKKKEERFHPSGQLLWDRGELERPFVPRSNVHKHTVTAGESKNPKDHRRENWDQPGY